MASKKSDRETMTIGAGDVGTLDLTPAVASEPKPTPAQAPPPAVPEPEPAAAHRLEYVVAPGKTLKLPRGTVRAGEPVFERDFATDGHLQLLVEKSAVIARQAPVEPAS